MTSPHDQVEPTPLTWVEISERALMANARLLQKVAAGSKRSPITCVMVKGNGYGHGLIEASRCFVKAGIDWLGVADIREAQSLRSAGVQAPLYAVCHVAPNQVHAAVKLGLKLTVYDAQTVQAASRAVHDLGRPCHLHLKLETGTNRQGLRHDQALQLAQEILDTPGLVLEGLSTHFADIEDTTDHGFAKQQLARFQAGLNALRDLMSSKGEDPNQLMAHASNSAAVMLWPEVSLDMVRFGIAAYGMWPSKETFLSAQQLGRRPLDLQPAMTWKTVVAQVREVPSGEWVGYGRTFQALRDSKIAILPIGYYDGYDRRFSSRSQVLIGGHKAPIAGRVAMNMVAVDVTDNPTVTQGDEVVLLGSQQAPDGSVSALHAEQLARWIGTINYEVVTRINDRIDRVLKD